MLFLVFHRPQAFLIYQIQKEKNLPQNLICHLHLDEPLEHDPLHCSLIPSHSTRLPWHFCASCLDSQP
ncbi:hypothetical protein LINGRAHAP2_LOCUS15231 [Linum grandiflorum]